jgi:beta-lactamase superfamily II metal-dependent hydrolase
VNLKEEKLQEAYLSLGSNKWGHPDKEVFNACKRVKYTGGP